MDTFTSPTTNLPLDHWFGLVRIGDSVPLHFSVSSFLAMVLSRCCAKLADAVPTTPILS
jgi:hypothetical protein